MQLGEMAMPADFRYREVFFRGRPRHGQQDVFSLRHPAMDRGKRAKIFSSFDALKGFSDAVAAKDVLYVGRPELTDEEQLEIGRRLSVLHQLVPNGRAARAGRIRVRVTYFSPCADKDSFAYGLLGRLATVSGLCRRVDGVSRTLTLDSAILRFEDVTAIEADRIFDQEPETEEL